MISRQQALVLKASLSLSKFNSEFIECFAKEVEDIEVMLNSIINNPANIPGTPEYEEHQAKVKFLNGLIETFK